MIQRLGAIKAKYWDICSRARRNCFNECQRCALSRLEQQYSKCAAAVERGAEPER